MKGELGGTGCCGGSSSSVAMVASARYPGFESISCPFFLPFLLSSLHYFSTASVYRFTYTLQTSIGMMFDGIIVSTILHCIHTAYELIIIHRIVPHNTSGVQVKPSIQGADSMITCITHTYGKAACGDKKYK